MDQFCWPLTVNIITNQNNHYSLRIKDPKGSPENLLTSMDVKDKFMKNTIPILGEYQAGNFYNALSMFDQLTNIKEILLSIVEKNESNLDLAVSV